MTNLEGKIRKTVGNTYGLRTWIEYGFKHAKNELGWVDYRVNDYASIERCENSSKVAYLLVSLQSPMFQHTAPVLTDAQGFATITAPDRFSQHRRWDNGQGWKKILNNLRLISSHPLNRDGHPGDLRGEGDVEEERLSQRNFTIL